MTRITSNFSHGADGWTIQGDVADFEWMKTGGHPGGSIFWEDSASGADSYWQAPAKFTGDLGGFKRGALSFDWYASADNYQTGDVLVTGANGTTLVGDVANPGADWTHASISLGVDGGWHIGSIDGELATKRQIAAVLANVTGIQVRAEHVNGAETGGLDNVTLASRPAPTHPAADAFGADRHLPEHIDPSALAAHHAFDALHVMLV